MSRKLYIKRFGGQMNECDSSHMADALKASHGLDMAPRAEQPDVLLLNTCSVHEKPQ